MEDKDRARYYEAHDADETWAEPEYDAPKDRSRFSATITVRFPPDEAQRIRRIAKDTHATYSDVIRKAVCAYEAPAEPRVSITQAAQNQTWAVGSSLTAAVVRAAAITLERTDQTPITTSPR